MAVQVELKNKFEEAFAILQSNLVESFEEMQAHPEEKAEIIDEWKFYLNKFVNEATNLSEQYKNKDLIKAITRMFIFGR